MARANPPLEERYFVLFVVSLGVIATGQYSILQQDRQPRRLATIELIASIRYQLGEGIEKQQSDFAAEVAAAAGVKNDEAVA
jgi:hypothetical protein